MQNSFKNPLPGVPLVESPFFERLLDQAEPDAETRRIAQDLHSKGYAILTFPEPRFAETAERLIGELTPHYDWSGWQSGARPDRNMLSGFDPAAYLAANPDVAAAQADPVMHYLDFGRYEGRRIR